MDFLGRMFGRLLEVSGVLEHDHDHADNSAAEHVAARGKEHEEQLSSKEPTVKPVAVEGSKSTTSSRRDVSNPVVPSSTLNRSKIDSLPLAAEVTPKLSTPQNAPSVLTRSTPPQLANSAPNAKRISAITSGSESDVSSLWSHRTDDLLYLTDSEDDESSSTANTKGRKGGPRTTKAAKLADLREGDNWESRADRGTPLLLCGQNPTRPEILPGLVTIHRGPCLDFWAPAPADHGRRPDARARSLPRRNPNHFTRPGRYPRPHLRRSHDSDEPAPPGLTDKGKVENYPVQLIADGGVRKVIVTKGMGGPPADTATVTHVYKVSDNDSFRLPLVYNMNRENPIKTKLGSAEVLPGLEIGLLTMTKGERAQIRIEPRYGYGWEGNSRMGISPTTVLYVDVEVLDLHDTSAIDKFCATDPHVRPSMYDSDDYEGILTELHEAGKIAFADRNFAQAQKYFLEGAAGHRVQRLGVQDEIVLSQRNSIIARLHNNAALCALEEKNWEEAKRQAQIVVDLKACHQSCMKACYMMGKAYNEQQKYEDAIVFARRGLRHNANSPELKKLLEKSMELHQAVLSLRTSKPEPIADISRVAARSEPAVHIPRPVATAQPAAVPKRFGKPLGKISRPHAQDVGLSSEEKSVMEFLGQNVSERRLDPNHHLASSNSSTRKPPQTRGA